MLEVCKDVLLLWASKNCKYLNAKLIRKLFKYGMNLALLFQWVEMTYSYSGTLLSQTS